MLSTSFRDSADSGALGSPLGVEDVYTMSSSDDNEEGAESSLIIGDVPDLDTPSGDDQRSSEPGAGVIAELLQEERDAPSTPLQLGNGVNRYKAINQRDDASVNSLEKPLPVRPCSPVESVYSNPDDTPSIQVCEFTFLELFGSLLIIARVL